MENLVSEGKLINIFIMLQISLDFNYTFRVIIFLLETMFNKILLTINFKALFSYNDIHLYIGILVTKLTVSIRSIYNSTAQMRGGSIRTNKFVNLL